MATVEEVRELFSDDRMRAMAIEAKRAVERECAYIWNNAFKPMDGNMLGGNANHPRKGSRIKVEPIMGTEDIARIKGLIRNWMHLALFTTGINTNLRASDLVRLTAGQVRGMQPMQEIEIKEKKTGKTRRISLNATCLASIYAYLQAHPLQDDERLFPLTVPSVHRLVKNYCRLAGLKGNYGSHTLRKTWGYHQRVTFGVSLPNLMTCFNHSSQRQTLDYLCIQPEEVKCVYANEI